MAKKDIGVIIQFDDKEYSDQERGLLFGRFLVILAEAAQQQEKEKQNAKCVKFPNHSNNKY